MTRELEPATSDDTPIPASTALTLYTSNDLALCSTDEARALFPYESATKMQLLPIAVVRTGRGLKVHCAAASDGDDLRRAARFVSGVEAIISVVDGDVLEDAIVRAYLGSDVRVRSSIEKLSSRHVRSSELSASKIPKAQGDAAKFLTTLLEFAVARGASDLHLCPSPQGAFIRLRIDGELLSQDAHHYPRVFHEQLIARLKVLAGLDIACRRLPQDGAFTFEVGAKTKCVRLSTLPTIDGESAVLRFLYSRRLPQLSTLGIEPVTMSIVRRALSKSQGMIILAGPTGSGKTTTMYSLALELQNQGRNVVSVEDPVEAPIPGMVQVQVHEQQGLDYPKAIRSVLRHDPDVILIGEMRDAISARMALSIATTGHLTISSLHMGSALEALERFRTFDISPRESSQAVSLIINQRLLPKLCPRCKAVDRAGEARLRRVVYLPQGCPACSGTGFDNRVLVSEALDLEMFDVKDLYGRSQSIHEARATLPSSAHIPWSYGLEYHLERGDISVAQLDAFIDEEMSA